MREVKVEIAKVYVPMARRKSLDAARVAALAEDILENGNRRRSWFALTPIGWCWWKGCIGWRRAGRWGTTPSSP